MVMVMVIDGDSEIPRDFTIPSVTIMLIVPLAIIGDFCTVTLTTTTIPVYRRDISIDIFTSV
jgi:hypothetical protein